MGSHGNSGLSYRPDIDGLRAIAVLAVALFHAEIPGFGGGYVGVDVFFVISGYLITGIIYAGAREGRFSYLTFYERRIRRLLPALFLVAAAVVAFTLLYRSPRDAEIFGESVSLFALFAANFFFYAQLDYFADPSAFYPLLHMWSLAVEEQFYLVWPPLLLAIWRWRPASLKAALAAIVAISFIASVVAVAYDPQLAFFHTPFRMWQLGLGGLLALTPPLFSSEGARRNAAAFGLAAIAAAILLYDEATPFPGLAAAPPTLGAALVIAAGVGAPSGVVGRMLASGPLVFIGLCSYSFYLWHWPALSAARYLSFEPLTHLEALGVVALSFALAVLTWRFVERPFRRRGGLLSRRGMFAAAALGVAALLLVGWRLQDSKGMPGRFPELAAMFAEDARKYGLSPAACRPVREGLPAELRDEVDPAFCLAHQAAPGRPTILLWGDSHAWALAPGLADWAEASDVALYVAWSPICPPLLGVDRAAQTRFHDCLRQNAAAPQVAQALGAREVVLAAQWSRYTARPGFAEALARTARAFSADGVRLVAVEETPPHATHVPTVLFRAAAIGVASPLEQGRAALELSTRESREILRRAAEAAGVDLVSPADALCPDDFCAVQAPDGAPLYADFHHLNRRGARFIGRRLGEAAGLAQPRETSRREGGER